ncbi:MAG: hypothetical protein ACRD0J_04950, partial [Acidimicrobiales bacterium]
TWKERAERDFAAGLAFDMRTKHFLVPQAPERPTAPTVFELTELYYRQHLEWEPATKAAAGRAFNRARRWLLAAGAEPTSDQLVAIDDYLEHAGFLPAHLADRVTDRQRAGEAWLKTHSAPADSLTSAQIEAFVARFEVNERNPTKRVSAATITRFLQPLKACWAWAVERDDLLIDRSPWVVVKPRRKVKGKSTMAAGRAGLAVDVDMVLDVRQSLALAEGNHSAGSTTRDGPWCRYSGGSGRSRTMRFCHSWFCWPEITAQPRGIGDAVASRAGGPGPRPGRPGGRPGGREPAALG